MIREMYDLLPHDTVHQLHLLRCFRKSMLCVREMYSIFQCQTCKKVDERAALELGFAGGIEIRSNRPVFNSSEDLFIVSKNAKEVLQDCLGEFIEYFPITGSCYSVATARVIYRPIESIPGFAVFGGRCDACGRAKELLPIRIPDAKPLKFLPIEVPVKSRFCAVGYESTMGLKEHWIVTKEVARELKKARPPLSGLTYEPIDVI